MRLFVSSLMRVINKANHKNEKKMDRALYMTVKNSTPENIKPLTKRHFEYWSPLSQSCFLMKALSSDPVLHCTNAVFVK